MLIVTELPPTALKTIRSYSFSYTTAWRTFFAVFQLAGTSAFGMLHSFQVLVNGNVSDDSQCTQRWKLENEQMMTTTTTSRHGLALACHTNQFYLGISKTVASHRTKTNETTKRVQLQQPASWQRMPTTSTAIHTWRLPLTLPSLRISAELITLLSTTVIAFRFASVVCTILALARDVVVKFWCFISILFAIEWICRFKSVRGKEKNGRDRNEERDGERESCDNEIFHCFETK